MGPSQDEQTLLQLSLLSVRLFCHSEPTKSTSCHVFDEKNTFFFQIEEQLGACDKSAQITFPFPLRRQEEGHLAAE